MLFLHQPRSFTVILTKEGSELTTIVRFATFRCFAALSMTFAKACIKIIHIQMQKEKPQRLSLVAFDYLTNCIRITIATRLSRQIQSNSQQLLQLAHHQIHFLLRVKLRKRKTNSHRIRFRVQR